MTRLVIVVFALVVACGGASAPTPAAPSNQAPSPEPAPTNVQYVGNPTASVVIHYWFDYQCLACAIFAPTIDELGRRYGDRIVVYYKNFPIDLQRYDLDVADPLAGSMVDAEYEAGADAGVSYAPYLSINGTEIDDTRDLDRLSAVIDARLAEAL